MIHVVQTRAYCGMLLLHGEYEDLADARTRAAKRLRYLRGEGYPITKLDHHEWEIEEPEGCLMVPDACGILRIATIDNEESEE